METDSSASMNCQGSANEALTRAVTFCWRSLRRERGARTGRTTMGRKEEGRESKKELALNNLV
jgi:hypothetical protein